MTSDELVAKIFVEDLPTITSVDCGTQISRLSRRFLTLHARDTPSNSRWSFFAAGIAAQLQFHGELSNTEARVDMEWRSWKPVSQCKSKLFPFIPLAGTAKPYGEKTLGSVDTLSLISEINFPAPALKIPFLSYISLSFIPAGACKSSLKWSRNNPSSKSFTNEANIPGPRVNVAQGKL